MSLMLTFDLDLDMEQGHIYSLEVWYSGQRSSVMMTYFYNEVKVKGHDLGHYPAKLLKHCTFLQNVFAFFITHWPSALIKMM